MILIALSIFLLSCQKEDPRAQDFSITYELKDERRKSQWVEGHIKNNSSTPANKVKIKVELYQGLVKTNNVHIKIKEEMFMGDSVAFCQSIGDTISSVEMIIYSVE